MRYLAERMREPSTWAALAAVAAALGHPVPLDLVAAAPVLVALAAGAAGVALAEAKKTASGTE